MDRIAHFFNGKTLLITGGTGFLGKVLLEKVLRSCPDLKKVYLLIRTKKEKSAHSRLLDVFKSPLFNQLREDVGEDVFKKVEAVSGDVQYLGLGISQEDRKKLCEEVEVIYHSAATVRFDETLKVAVLLNVRGTREMVQLAKECPKLVVFNHVSTAYCQINEETLYEKFYPPPADPHQVISTCEWMSEEALHVATKALLGPCPNTYVYTKALAEGLLAGEIPNLPIIVTRPSVVVPIWKEPLPGWTDNLNGPIGLLVAGSKGLVWSLNYHPDAYMDYLPVDICVNGLLCSSVDFALNGTRRVFNFTTSNTHQISVSKMIDSGKQISNHKWPQGGGIWRTGGSCTTSKLTHFLKVLFLQLLPAYFLDLILYVIGEKPLLVRMQKRILKGQDVLKYFITHDWKFDNEAALSAIGTMNEIEKEKYKLDDEGFDFDEYMMNICISGRKYISKRGEDTLGMDLTIAKTMLMVERFFGVVLIYWSLCFLYNILIPFRIQ